MKMDIFWHITSKLRKIGTALGVILAGLSSLPAMAAITAGSCTVGTFSGSAYEMNTLPTTLTDGTVIASRVLITTFKYSKTGSSADTLLTGAWYTSGTINNTHHTIAVSGSVQGIGFRMSNLGYPGGYANGETFNQLNVRNATTAGTNQTMTDYWLQELVVTNASIYKGGTITGLGGTALSIVFGNQKVWTDKNTSVGSSRCVGLQILWGLDILSPEGGGSGVIPELPEPKTPTCDLGGTNIAVTLPDVDSSSLQNHGDISGSKSFSIPLGNCGKNAKPYITFTDSNDRANRSTTLGLAAASTAAGVGIVIEKSDGGLVQFGAQNTGVSSSNVGQYLIGTSTVDGSTLPLTLTAKYIRTNALLKAGEVKADAIFTIAYP
jgi:type 1 fimbria pilin